MNATVPSIDRRLAYLILGHAYSFVAVAIGAFLVGMGNGLLTPYTLALTANKVRPEQKDVAFGLVTAGIHIGLLCSPFLQALIVTVSYNASYRYLYMVSVWLFLRFFPSFSSVRNRSRRPQFPCSRWRVYRKT